MTTLGHESRLVQNHALGAVVLWRFARKYTDSHALHAPVPLCLAALVLPMVWHVDTATNIASTREKSGLRAFRDKFSDTQESRFDALLAIHNRSARWQDKTMGSLSMALGCGLIHLNDRAMLVPSGIEWHVNRHPLAVRNQVNMAEKLGTWFASLSLLEIANVLHIRF